MISKKKGVLNYFSPFALNIECISAYIQYDCWILKIKFILDFNVNVSDKKGYILDVYFSLQLHTSLVKKK